MMVIEPQSKKGKQAVRIVAQENETANYNG